MKSEPSEPYLKQVLTRHGSKEGWNAFEELCKEGCDPDILSWSILWLYDEPVRIKDVPPDNTNAPRFEMKPTPLDSNEARGEFSLAQLDAIAKVAEDLQGQLQRIRQIPFVRELIARGYFSPNDLLNPQSLHHTMRPETRLNGLVGLGDLARKFGSQKRPNYTARLKAIYQHIHEHAEQWHDRLVADILNDIKPDQPQTEDSLKVWRHRNGCA